MISVVEGLHGRKRWWRMKVGGGGSLECAAREEGGTPDTVGKPGLHPIGSCATYGLRWKCRGSGTRGTRSKVEVGVEVGIVDATWARAGLIA